MRATEHCAGGLLLLTIAERTLARAPAWDQTPALRHPEAQLVALDFADVEFVSSLFYQGCLELNSRLTERGQALALVHLSPQQRQVLELVEGSSRLTVVEEREELDDRLRLLQPREEPDGAVSAWEKRKLWG
jgi:anti-anti-sigma regulatory factor